MHSMLKSARVLDNQICYDIKDANHIYEICAMRFKLHKIVYNHKAGIIHVSKELSIFLLILSSAKAIEYMIIDGLLAAEKYMKIAERIFKPERYVHLTDNILTTIEETESPVRR
jgi:deoxynucleoside triphosphate triphosphohydrolase SAMHD1